jgi:N-methylhydantoinase A
VPLSPGILCAEGVAISDVQESFVVTCRVHLDEDLSPVADAVDKLTTKAKQWSDGAKDVIRTISLDMRYVGQNYELSVPLDGDNLPAASELRERFLATHQLKYGHSDPTAAIEFVNVRVKARIAQEDEGTPKLRQDAVDPARTTVSAWFDSSGPVETTVVHRSTLEPGARLEGPAIITQFDSTTVVPPRWLVRVDAARNIIMELQP